MRNISLFTLLGLTAIVSLGLTSSNIANATSVRLYVFDPITQANVSSASINENFVVQVSVADAEFLVAFEFYLTWNTSILSFVQLAEGPFLNSSGAYPSYFVSRYPGSTGWTRTDTIYAADTLVGAQLGTSASGTGVLATVTFKVLAKGVDKLDLHNSMLLRYDPFTPKEVPHTAEDGYFALPLPKVIVKPVEIISSGIEPAQDIAINITVENIENVYNWTLKLKWEPTLLNEKSAEEGPFLSDEGTTSFSSIVNQEGGFLYINNTLTGDTAAGASGNATIAMITFTVEARGTTDLRLYEVALFTKNGAIIPVAPENGFFSNVLRDVAVISVEVSATSVSKGQSVDITVVVENHGLVNETFTVRVDYDSHSVGSTSVTNLAPNAQKTVVLTWDTADVSDGSYTIKATASNVQGETNTADNTRTATELVRVSSGEGFNNMLLIGGGIAVVAVIAVIGFLLYRRSKK